MEMQRFQHPQFTGSIRAITDEKGEPWFIAKDLALILEYSDTEAMTRKLDNDEKNTCTDNSSGQVRHLTIINESGLYSAILRATLPGAKVFKKWVTGTVLPEIRKYGRYLLVKDGESDLQILARANMIAMKVIEDRDHQIAKITEERNEAVRTKAQISSKREATALAKLSWQTRWEREKEEYIARYGREEYEKDCPSRCGGILFYGVGRSPEALAKKLAEKEKAWRDMQKREKKIQTLDEQMREYRRNH